MNNLSRLGLTPLVIVITVQNIIRLLLVLNLIRKVAGGDIHITQEDDHFTYHYLILWNGCSHSELAF